MWHEELARRCANKLNSLNKRIAENVKIWSINGKVTHEKKKTNDTDTIFAYEFGAFFRLYNNFMNVEAYFSRCLFQ